MRQRAPLVGWKLRLGEAWLFLHSRPWSICGNGELGLEPVACHSAHSPPAGPTPAWTSLRCQAGGHLGLGGCGDR